MSERVASSGALRKTSNASRLKITEVFRSLQGEALQVGLPTTFIRLTGCPLRCQYCDSAYAFHGGQWREIDDLLADPLVRQSRHICVTGGEPLAQKACIALLEALCDAGHEVSLETSGAIDIASVDQRVCRVVDIKTPDSGEVRRNLWDNLERLTASDQVKVVICSRADFDWAVTIIKQYGLLDRCSVLVSPSFGQVEPAELAQWVLDSGLSLRFQLQLHKLLWGDEPGH